MLVLDRRTATGVCRFGITNQLIIARSMSMIYYPLMATAFTVQANVFYLTARLQCECMYVCTYVWKGVTHHSSATGTACQDPAWISTTLIISHQYRSIELYKRLWIASFSNTEYFSESALRVTYFCPRGSSICVAMTPLWERFWRNCRGAVNREKS